MRWPQVLAPHALCYIQAKRPDGNNHGCEIEPPLATASALRAWICLFWSRAMARRWIWAPRSELAMTPHETIEEDNKIPFVRTRNVVFLGADGRTR